MELQPNLDYAVPDRWEFPLSGARNMSLFFGVIPCLFDVLPSNLRTVV